MNKGESMKEETFTQISAFKARTNHYIFDASENDFPVVLIFDKGIGKPKYTFTLECINPNSFVDENGIKWVKANE